jgi:hypothetical protein
MKEELLSNTSFITDLLKSIMDGISSAIPIFLGALFILIVGWLLARVLSILLKKILEKTKIDEWAKRINLGEVTGEAMTIKPSKVLSKILFWVIILIFFVATAERLGLQIVVNQLTMLINYIPQLLVSVFIFSIGVYIATFIRDAISTATSSLGMSSGKLISKVVFYFLLIIISITALDQAGIDTTIISSNITLIIGAILLAGSIAYGFAAKGIMSNILATFYAKKNFKAGQKIRINDVEGIITEIDSVSIKIYTGENYVVLPSKLLVDEKVIILEDINDNIE